jgi:hypothetical protein
MNKLTEWIKQHQSVVRQPIIHSLTSIFLSHRL